MLKKCDDMHIRLDTISQRDGQRQTDGNAISISCVSGAQENEQQNCRKHFLHILRNIAYYCLLQVT